MIYILLFKNKFPHICFLGGFTRECSIKSKTGFIRKSGTLFNFFELRIFGIGVNIESYS